MQIKIFTEEALANVEGQANERKRCAYALEFLPWTERLCTEYSQSPAKIAQAKVMLVDRYDQWCKSVPRAHRHHASDRGHFCIWHVAFEYAYPKLRQAELAHTGPLLFLPPDRPSPPPAPVVHSIAGITLGEVMGE